MSKKCEWCGREFPPGELSNAGNCYDCAYERMKRWNDLVREAHRTFRQEEIDNANKKVGNSDLEEIGGDKKEG